MTGSRYEARITALPMAALFEARGSERSLAVAMAAAGLPWPGTSGVIDGGAAGAQVMRFGPARVLIRAGLEEEAELGRKMEAAFASQIDADVALVSDMYRAFHIAGPDAEDVLRQGTPLDLSPAAHPEGCVAATEIWAISAIIIREHARESCFTLLVDNSHAGYIADWLSVANGGSPAASPGVMTNPPRPLAP